MAPADVHGTLGGVHGCLRNLRGPADRPNEPSGCGMEDFAEPIGFQVGVRGCLPNFCERDTHF